MRLKLLILLSLLIISIPLVQYNKKNTEIHDYKIEQQETTPVLSEKPVINLSTYMPVIKDTVWTFSDNETGKNYTLSIDFMKEKVFQLRIAFEEKVVAKVYVQEEGTLYEVATIEDARIKQDYTNFRQYKEIILKLPLEKGNAWYGKDGQTKSITRTDLSIQTEIGEVKALEVTTKGEDFIKKDYYGEKIGPIKSIYIENGEKHIYEIEAFETSKPIEQEIELYLADEKTSKIEVIRQKVLVRTNEEPKHFLTDLLKKEIDEKYIIPMPKNAVIENIYKDEENRILHINLSKEYYEINYGSHIESLALKSLINTVGNYYDVDQIVLTVGGEPYQSGHLFFQQGETILVDREKE